MKDLVIMRTLKLGVKLLPYSLPPTLQYICTTVENVYEIA